MNDINIGKNITKLRRQKGITQDELAHHIGVSKSSVSKWENNITYPDILLLPELAALFNVSLDELIGYEPKLVKEDIREIYYNLADEFSKKKPEEVLKKCESYIKKYYSCFEFLKQMVVLYMNHFMLFEDKDDILNRGIALCNRIKQESNEPKLIKEIVSMEAVLLFMANRPVEVLDLLGEDAALINSDSELISMSFQLLGNIEKADEISQVCMYQHLLSLISDGIQHIFLNMSDLEVVEQSAKRLIGVCDLFEIDNLHPNTSIKLYLCIAQAYTINNKKEDALDMIEKYVRVFKANENSFILKGDKFFNKIEGWLSELDLGVRAIRNDSLIKQSAISGIKDNPLFDSLREEPRYKSCMLFLES